MPETPGPGPKRPEPPSGLDSTGSRLWRAVWADLPANLGLDEVEVCTLLDACLLEDRAASLRRLVKRQGQMLGEKLHPAISEERQCRMAARRLVATIDMTGRPQRAQAKSARARVAANARWGASGA